MERRREDDALHAAKARNSIKLALGWFDLVQAGRTSKAKRDRRERAGLSEEEAPANHVKPSCYGGARGKVCLTAFILPTYFPCSAAGGETNFTPGTSVRPSTPNK